VFNFDAVGSWADVAVDDRACILLLTGLLVLLLLTVVSGILEGCIVRVVFLKMSCCVTAVSTVGLQLQTSGSTTVVLLTTILCWLLLLLLNAGGTVC
jgi:hypothetical protein